ncbi:uncharacterized protein Bfra_011488 [Botrytis fragariae]|uniref:Uncharacterized protein n=1 Tax=Botrytis fragariae TaxID=1964551 RepID=A0A8H6AYG0_9HELO|nr:uncharacterized protein Bfra_011488 [Botrytis fragariae]KAF5875725.1 hypothetical protein Bfra_011488 [Botrytis fragariae]
MTNNCVNVYDTPADIDFSRVYLPITTFLPCLPMKFHKQKYSLTQNQSADTQPNLLTFSFAPSQDAHIFPAALKCLQITAR